MQGQTPPFHENPHICLPRWGRQLQQAGCEPLALETLA